MMSEHAVEQAGEGAGAEHEHRHAVPGRARTNTRAVTVMAVCEPNRSRPLHVAAKPISSVMR
jgi:hypothetical protein